MAKAKKVSFNVTRVELDAISSVVVRAQSLRMVRGTLAPGHWYDGLTATMDLEACHANGTALDFNKLLAFDDFSFMHDIAGIARHMDRETGQLKDHFSPRCSR